MAGGEVLKGSRAWVERHWRRTELIIALGLTLLVWLLLGDGSESSRLGALISGDRSVLYGTMAGLAGALLGFVLAAGSIMAPMLESPWMKRVRESPQYPAMWGMFLAAPRGLGLLTLASLAALILDSDGGSFGFLAIVVLFLATLSALQVATSVWILESIVRILTERQQKADSSEGAPRPTGSPT